MSELVSWMKEIYTKAMSNDFEWKNIYPNNMPCNGVDGIYTDMCFQWGDKNYDYIKYSIEYCSRCDEEGFSHPEEGTKYYVLHELRMNHLEEKISIPEPADDFLWDETLACLVNDYGRFRYVFDDAETAKRVVANELLRMLYPCQYLLDEEERKEWKEFYDSQKEEDE